MISYLFKNFLPDTGSLEIVTLFVSMTGAEMGLDGTEREVWCTGGGGLERGVEGDVDERRRSLTEMVAGGWRIC